MSVAEAELGGSCLPWHVQESPQRLHPCICLCALVAGRKGFWSADLEQFGQQKGHKTVAFPVNQRVSWGAVGAWGRSGVWMSGERVLPGSAASDPPGDIT